MTFFSLLLQNFRLSRQNCHLQLNSVQIIIFRLKSHHFRTYFLYMTRYNVEHGLMNIAHSFFSPSFHVLFFFFHFFYCSSFHSLLPCSFHSILLVFLSFLPSCFPFLVRFSLLSLILSCRPASVLLFLTAFQFLWFLYWLFRPTSLISTIVTQSIGQYWLVSIVWSAGRSIHRLVSRSVGQLIDKHLITASSISKKLATVSTTVIAVFSISTRAYSLSSSRSWSLFLSSCFCWWGRAAGGLGEFWGEALSRQFNLRIFVLRMFHHWN